MSYYLLPKNKTKIDIKIVKGHKHPKVIVSESLYNYTMEIICVAHKACLLDSEFPFSSFNEMTKYINPFECIFSLTYNSIGQISKVKGKTQIFYELVELLHTINQIDKFKITNPTIVNIGHNMRDNSDAAIFIDHYNNNNNNNNNNNIYSLNDLELLKKPQIKLDLIFYEIENNSFDNLKLYTLELLKCVMLILKNQALCGNSIIKISYLYHKPILQILYYLNSIYDKVYIIKPQITSATDYDRYIICKKLHIEDSNIIDNNLEVLTNIILSNDNEYIYSVIDCEIPLLFINKIEDINVILGQQQIETYDQLLSIVKNKNRIEKLELLNKYNLSKSIAWCEKYKVPCNKSIDRINQFLPLVHMENIEEPVTDVKKM